MKILSLILCSLFLIGCSGSGPPIVQYKNFTPAYTTIVEKLSGCNQGSGISKETTIHAVAETRAITYNPMGSDFPTTTNVTKEIWAKYNIGDIWREGEFQRLYPECLYPVNSPLEQPEEKNKP